MSRIRLCLPNEHATMLAIVNCAAEAYRGVIPADRWREPYMSLSELQSAIAAGIVFWGCEVDDALIAVMGTQTVRDVELIRHAYVLPTHQHHGVGRALLVHLMGLTSRPILVGTWASADWAIRFYQRPGFELVSPQSRNSLLKTYWAIPERQIETSVVLAHPPLR